MSEYCKDIVVFGTQYVFRYINDVFNEDFFKKDKNTVCQEAKEILSGYIGQDYDVSHFEALHDLGYLPVSVKALEEGLIIKPGIPLFTIKNTLPEFFWVTNFLETLISTLIWKPIHSASVAYGYKKLLTRFAKETGSDLSFINFQGHDFSFRGMQSVESAISSGMGFLTSFMGSDTLPTIQAAKHYYNTPTVSFSVPASEHSVMCSHGKESEINTLRYLMSQYPTGILSVVSDTWDLWKLLTVYLPELKEEILARDGKLVVRPDSGDPADILCGVGSKYRVFDKKKILDEWLYETAEENEGVIFKFKDKYYKIGDVEYFIREYGEDNTYLNFDDMLARRQSLLEDVTKTIDDKSPSFKGVVELLWDIFGGTINEKGYKVLDNHIGAIYGDSITPERLADISQRLMVKGFASQVVFGVGSYSLSHATRDNQGGAIKSTYVVVDGEGRDIYKDPITDNGTKKSAKGLLKVDYDTNGDITLYDQVSWEEESTGLLQHIFIDGNFVKETTITDIRAKLDSTL
jgi:nicotinamide phosphoribosyltransferase